MPQLSDREWTVLSALWDAGAGASLGEVTEALRPETGWSRNTVLTYLTRMEAKGLVVIDKNGAPHRYRAGADREPAGPGSGGASSSGVPGLHRGPGGSLFEGGAPVGGEREALRRLLDEMEV